MRLGIGRGQCVQRNRGGEASMGYTVFYPCERERGVGVGVGGGGRGVHRRAGSRRGWLRGVSRGGLELEKVDTV